MPAQLSAGNQENAGAATKRPYTISKETTYFTGPLKPDGSIDFIAAVNEHFSQGITAENNAAGDILQLISPECISRRYGKEWLDQAMIRLGIERNSRDGENLFVDFSEFVKHRGEDDRDACWRQFRAARDRPWTIDEFPAVNDWLQSQSNVLAKLRMAARKDRFFVPLLTLKPDDGILIALPEHAHAIRGIGLALAVRANLHLGHRHWREAWDDILTVHALSGLVKQGADSIERLVGTATAGLACEAAKQFIKHADANKVDWTSLQESWTTNARSDLVESEEFTGRARCIAFCLSIVDSPDKELFSVMLKGKSMGEAPWSDPLGMANQLPPALRRKAFRQMVDSRELDLNKSLRIVNGVFDQAIATATMENAKRRQDEFRWLESEFDAETITIDSAFEIGVDDSDPSSRAYAQMALFNAPTGGTIFYGIWRSQASIHVIELALAARAFQARTGRLPDSIEQLKPWAEASVFVQPASGSPVAFLTTSTEILIYHWCANRKDDGGQIDPNRPLDWGIRIKK